MSSRRESPNLSDLVPLPDRIASTTALRAGLVVAPLGLALLLPESLAVTWRTLAACAAGYLTCTLVVGCLGRASRRATVPMLMLSLQADAAYLGAVLAAFGGLAGPGPYLVGLHVLGVTLLASFRSGIKLTLWHSLVGLVVLEAMSLGMLGHERHAFPTRPFTQYLALLWIMALATATFAAVNERELRRRRYDADVLQRFASVAERLDDPQLLLAALARVAVDDLSAERAVAAVLPGSTVLPGAAGQPEHSSVRACAAVHRVEGGAAGAAVPADLGADLGPASLLGRAVLDGTPVLAAYLRPDTDPWLAGLLPGAKRLLAVPFGSSDEVVAVLVLECRHTGPPWKSATLERRVIATAVQAGAHAGQALSRALLIARLRDTAQRDGLTGIANRRALDTAIDAAVDRQRSGGAAFSLLLLDLDHFKGLNDRHGHQAGDRVLRDVAQGLQRALPAGALVARYGGEEFAVLLPGGDPDAALAVAEDVRRTVAATATAVPVTVSVGVGLCPDHGAEAVQVLRAADEGLYAAKAAGRNCVRLAGPAAAAPVVAAPRAGEETADCVLPAQARS